MSNNSISQPTARTFSVVDLVTETLEGRIRIPEFQRPLRWQWEDVRRLFDSIIRGYPIGNLLIWKRKAFSANVKLGGLQINAREFDEGWWIVDGQQRLTSLANALCVTETQDDRFLLAYDLNNGVLVRPGKIEDGYIVPLPVLYDLTKLIHWFTKDHPEASEKLDEAARITKIIREYSVPAYIVDRSDEATLRDIFDRMNNYGRRLSLAEVFSALHPGEKVEGGGGISVFQRISESIHAERGFGIIDDDTVMRSVLARRGGNIARDIRVEFSENVRERDFSHDTPEDAYQNGKYALLRAIEFLQEDAGVPHFSFLVYRYLLVVLVRFFALFPEPQPRNRELLRRWFWRAVMIGPAVFSSSWTVAGRTLAMRIVANDEVGSVSRLLEEPISGHLYLPALTRFKTSSAHTRIVMSALWSLKPCSPLTYLPYTRQQLADAISPDGTAKEVAHRIFSREPNGYNAWAANRMIVLESELPESLTRLLSNGQELIGGGTREEFLVSHAINSSNVNAVVDDDKEAFLRGRQDNLKIVAEKFLLRMSGGNLEDTPPLSTFDLDDMDEGRDDGSA